MKEVLRVQGLIAHATVREPQLGVDEAERRAAPSCARRGTHRAAKAVA